MTTKTAKYKMQARKVLETCICFYKVDNRAGFGHFCMKREGGWQEEEMMAGLLAGRQRIGNPLWKHKVGSRRCSFLSTLSPGLALNYSRILQGTDVCSTAQCPQWLFVRFGWGRRCSQWRGKPCPSRKEGLHSSIHAICALIETSNQ